MAKNRWHEWPDDHVFDPGNRFHSFFWLFQAKKPPCSSTYSFHKTKNPVLTDGNVVFLDPKRKKKNSCWPLPKDWGTLFLLWAKNNFTWTTIPTPPISAVMMETLQLSSLIRISLMWWYMQNPCKCRSLICFFRMCSTHLVHLLWHILNDVVFIKQNHGYIWAVVYKGDRKRSKSQCKADGGPPHIFSTSYDSLYSIRISNQDIALLLESHAVWVVRCFALHCIACII